MSTHVHQKSSYTEHCQIGTGKTMTSQILNGSSGDNWLLSPPPGGHWIIVVDPRVVQSTELGGPTFFSFQWTQNLFETIILIHTKSSTSTKVVQGSDFHGTHDMDIYTLSLPSICPDINCCISEATYVDKNKGPHHHSISRPFTKGST